MKNNQQLSFDFIIDDLLAGGVDTDLTDFMSDAALAEAFVELVACIGRYQPRRELSRDENQAERLEDALDFVEETITYHVTQGGKYA
jgi:hypothetical protein